MSKALQLSIPKPCHENWNEMTHAEKGKFCGSCQKQVIDFTRMSDRDLAAFFKKPSTGSVCGRFNNDQLNKELEIPRKRIPWLKYFFTIAIPAFFASSKAIAQGQVRRIVRDDTTVKVSHTGITLGNALPGIKCVNPVVKNQIDTIDSPLDIVKGEVMPQISIRENVITGKIINETGTRIPFATIRIKGTQQAVAADSSGNFNLKPGITDPVIEVSAIGYESKEQYIDFNKKENIITLSELKTALVGELIITRCFKRSKPLPPFKQIFQATAFKNFKFYPNPATPGSAITIQWEKAGAGEFELQLVNQDGQMVKRTIENFAEKNNSIEFSIPAVAAGNYFLVMTNKKSGKRLTEKIIIQ
jgi:hypothetical protein